MQRIAADTYSRSVEERLYSDNEKKLENREKMRRLQEEREYSQCTFKPDIRKSTSALPPRPGNNFRPIHERLEEIQNAKNAKLQRLRMEQEYGNDNLSFKPNISATSKLMVDR